MEIEKVLTSRDKVECRSAANSSWLIRKRFCHIQKKFYLLPFSKNTWKKSVGEKKKLAAPQRTADLPSAVQNGVR